jgi:hypothetical protein
VIDTDVGELSSMCSEFDILVFDSTVGSIATLSTLVFGPRLVLRTFLS